MCDGRLSDSRAAGNLLVGADFPESHSLLSVVPQPPSSTQTRFQVPCVCCVCENAADR